MSKALYRIEFAGRKRAIDLPQLAFASGVAGWISWYCWDAWHASSAIENMILILPVSVAAIVLYGFVIVGCFKPAAEQINESGSHRDPAARANTMKIVGSMALFVAFVLAGPVIGFDVACFAYMLLMLVFLGERRISILLLFPSLFCVAVIYCFGTLLSAPLPVLLLQGLNR